MTRLAEGEIAGIDQHVDCTRMLTCPDRAAAWYTTGGSELGMGLEPGCLTLSQLPQLAGGIQQWSTVHSQLLLAMAVAEDNCWPLTMLAVSSTVEQWVWVCSVAVKRSPVVARILQTSAGKLPARHEPPNCHQQLAFTHRLALKKGAGVAINIVDLA